MEINALEKSLNEGCKVWGFKTPNNLIVIEISKEGKLKGSGMEISLVSAIDNATKNYLVGEKFQKEVYRDELLNNPKSLKSKGALDYWIDQGGTIEIFKQGESFTVELKTSSFSRGILDYTSKNSVIRGESPYLNEAFNKALKSKPKLQKIYKAI